jgi:hypothetical protein
MNETHNWPCNTPSKNTSKSKTNTTTGKIVLKLVKILSFRNIGLLLIKQEFFETPNVCWWTSVAHQHTFPCKISNFKNS